MKNFFYIYKDDNYAVLVSNMLGYLLFYLKMYEEVPCAVARHRNGKCDNLSITH